VTHSGSFHADDVFSIAAFQLLLGKENIEVIRTRDEDAIAVADYVVDVGGVYDHDNKRYDHHQPCSPVRENGIPYAGFGLMWRHYGEQICGSAEVAQAIEEKLCVPIDAGDNAIQVWQPGLLDLQAFSWDGVLKAWQAVESEGEDALEQFLVAVDIARGYLERFIMKRKIKLRQKEQSVALYATSADKAILVSEEYLPRSQFIEYEDVNVLIFPRSDTNDWMAVAIQKEETGFATKVRFPEEWAGLTKQALQEVSGFSDAVVCHKDRYMFIAKSQESAIAAARLAK